MIPNFNIKDISFRVASSRNATNIENDNLVRVLSFFRSPEQREVAPPQEELVQFVKLEFPDIDDNDHDGHYWYQSIYFELVKSEYLPDLIGKLDAMYSSRYGWGRPNEGLKPLIREFNAFLNVEEYNHQAARGYIEHTYSQLEEIWTQFANSGHFDMSPSEVWIDVGRTFPFEFDHYNGDGFFDSLDDLIKDTEIKVVDTAMLPRYDYTTKLN